MRFSQVLTGNEQLRRRPMARVVAPLRMMGATVGGRDNGRLPPLCIQGGPLEGMDYTLPVASAQVKSAILLAGLARRTDDHPGARTRPGPHGAHAGGTRRGRAALGVELSRS